jgi:hemolysin (HlyC) family protein
MAICQIAESFPITMADSFWQRIKFLFGGRPTEETDGSDPRKKTFRQIIDAVEEEGLADEVDNEMLKGVLEFGDTIVREVMVPRTDIVYSDINDSIERIIELVLSSGHSRIPVVEGHLDNPRGVFYAMDLLQFWGKEKVNLAEVIREPFFIPETKRLPQLFEELRQRKTHLGIVIDEYGGTAGIVTLEDLIEEILGELIDEDEEPLEMIVPQSDGSVLFDGRVSLSEFADYYEVDEPDENIDTVSGLILFLSGKIPPVGEQFEYGELTLKVVEADHRSVKSIEVRKEKTQPED